MRPPHLVLLLAVLATPSPAPGRVLTGVAVDPQGQPVAGAAVWLPPENLTDEAYAAYVKAGPAAVTGADGRFTVTVPADLEGPPIDVCAPGSLTGRIEQAGGADRAAAGPLTVVVRPGARISGQVVDAAGDPLPGLYVATRLAGSSSSDLIMQASPCDRSGTTAGRLTDREGRFTLEPLEPGWYTVQAGDGLVASSPVRLAPGQALGGLRLVVEHDARVSGRITSPDGSPVPRATVSFGSATATTDAAGRYRLSGVPPGTTGVRAFESGHGTLYRDAELAAGENHLDLVVPDPAVIRGRVLRPDGSPAAGATVALRSGHTVTADDGTFRLRIPSGDGEATLTVQATGLAPTEIVIQDKPQQPALEIRLSRPGSIAGHIAGLHAPAGTRIAAESFLFTRQLLQVDAVADAAGRFHLSGLAPGRWVLAAAQEGRKKAVEVAVAPGAESAVDLVFSPTHRVSGWVVDGNGQPAACDTIVLAGKEDRIVAPCGAGGTFAAEAEDGSYTSWVGISGRGRLHDPVTVEVSGAPVDRLEIRLLDPVAVTGRILGLAPGEIPDSIQAERIGETYVLRSASAVADQDGGYRLEILPGDWEITAQLERRTAKRRLHIPAGVTRIDADLTFSARDSEKTP